MAEENEFPKEDGDALYASEYNNFFYETRFDILKFPKRTSSGDIHYTTNGNITDNFIYCDSLTIDSGVTMTVPAGTGPVYFYVDGDVNIEGDIKAWGVAGPTGYSGSFGSHQNGKVNNKGEESIVKLSATPISGVPRPLSGGSGGNGYALGGSGGGEDTNDGIAWSYSPTLTELKKIVAMKGYGHLIGCSGAVGGREYSIYTPSGTVDAGGDSGGCVIIVATGNVTISGEIDCDGKSPANSTMTSGNGTASGSGGGAGGTIILLSGKDIDGTSGTLTADGGDGANAAYIGTGRGSGGGGGSGGFVGLYCLGTYTSFSSITVTGGSGGAGKMPGAAGENGDTYINGV